MADKKPMQTIEPSPEQLAAFLEKVPDGQPIVMINLLRYRDQASYPPGSDATPCSGREAYGRYGEKALQFVAATGGRPIWMGSVKMNLIGPLGEEWDDAILVEYPSRQAFLEMVSNPDYQKIAVHRTAALADSRLIATLSGGSQLG